MQMGFPSGSVALYLQETKVRFLGWDAAAAAASKSLQLCPTLCNPIDSSPAGSSVHGILQARTLEWVAISYSNAWKWKVKVKSLSRVRLLNPLKRRWLPTPVFLRIPWTEEPGGLHTVHDVAKSWTQLSDWAHTHKSRSNQYTDMVKQMHAYINFVSYYYVFYSKRIIFGNLSNFWEKQKFLCFS